MSHQKLGDEDIAKLVSNVTRLILGISTEVTGAGQNSGEHMVALPIHGVPGMLVLMSTSDLGAARLGALMFAVDQQKVDVSMMKDSLGELANMTAGQIKSAIEPGHVLGLPGASKLSTEDLRNARAVHLRAGEVPITVYLVPQVAKNGAQA